MPEPYMHTHTIGEGTAGGRGEGEVADVLRSIRRSTVSICIRFVNRHRACGAVATLLRVRRVPFTVCDTTITRTNDSENCNRVAGTRHTQTTKQRATDSIDS